MKVLLIHAYSSTNAGDGLLVDESVALVRDAFPDSRLSILALDPDSFDVAGVEEVLHGVTGREATPSSVRLLVRGLAAGVLGRADADVARLRRDADLIVAVGGGYLRAKRPLDTVKMLATQFGQLPTGDTPAVYLAQSIGPLRLGTAAPVLRRLARAHAVAVRDDRSLALLRRRVPGAARFPDLALLGLPAAWDPHSVVRPGGHVGVVARALPLRGRARDRYVGCLREVLDALPESELLVQASARGNNDVAFYERHFAQGRELRLLREAVRDGASDRPGCVVSVRLHGSLESIRSGVPSVHLSYERKGWGAYEDLGIEDHVHNAYAFSPAAVTAQAEKLTRDASDYWQKVVGSTSRLAQRRAQIVAVLRSATGGAS